MREPVDGEHEWIRSRERGADELRSYQRVARRLVGFASLIAAEHDGLDQRCGETGISVHRPNGESAPSYSLITRGLILDAAVLLLRSAGFDSGQSGVAPALVLVAPGGHGR